MEPGLDRGTHAPATPAIQRPPRAIPGQDRAWLADPPRGWLELAASRRDVTAAGKPDMSVPLLTMLAEPCDGG